MNETNVLKDTTFETWIQKKEIQEFIKEYYVKEQTGMDSLEFLSVKAYNLLLINGISFLHQIILKSKEEIMSIPRMDEIAADEIYRTCSCFVKNNWEELQKAYLDQLQKEKEKEAEKEMTLSEIRYMPEYRESILKFVKHNDMEIRYAVLSNRPKNQLLKNGYHKLSDIIFLSREDLQSLPSMGKGSVEEVLALVDIYLRENESRIIAICKGDDSALYSDDSIGKMILKLYEEIGFEGLSFPDIVEKLSLPSYVSESRLKAMIGRLLKDGELEYVDYRCYRVYGKFEEILNACPDISDRNRECIRGRLDGKTLEAVAQEYNLTRERVRQIVKKSADSVRNWYITTTGKQWFDEDYYRYFYETYEYDKKECSKWLGISESVYHYLFMMDVKPGKKDLHDAMDDYDNLDAGLRLKIKNYLNRNKVFLRGIWIEKNRANLEEVAVKEICKNSMSFDEFAIQYNRFLEQEEIEYDENLYYTESIYASRKNRLSEARFLLWKMNEQMRYYDIDSYDYTELLECLNLESYENIEISTLKFMNEYPDMMKKYDIRDQYELHNLLRKIVPEGSYHDFHCGRMPEIKFGSFDRDQALYELMVNNAPISAADLAELIYEEYGYEQIVTMSTYLQHLSVYYHQGMYTVEQKVMSEQNISRLKTLLTEDFYYTEEVRQIYKKNVPGADVDEINPYNLKRMGFSVFSKYIVQNHDSLEAYCESLLTCGDVIDISEHRKKLTYVQMFWHKLNELKKAMEVVEFEPNQLIHYRKLEKFGITKEDMKKYCEDVFDFVEEDTYFSVSSIRNGGHKSELYDLGFSDCFYSGLLSADERFSYGRMFGNLIFYKGKANISIQTFEKYLIEESGIIDIYDLMTLMTEEYGCRITERTDLIYKVYNTDIYYDKYLERFYATAELYYRELDEMEGM